MLIQEINDVCIAYDCGGKLDLWLSIQYGILDT